MNLQSPITLGGKSLKMYASRLEKLGIFTFEDFLFHLPSRYDDFSLISKIGQIQNGEIVTIKGEVTEIKNQYLRGRRIKTIQNAQICDDNGKITLTWFNQPFLIKTLPVGSIVSVSGRAGLSKKGLAITSPDYEIISLNNADPNTEHRQTIHTGRLVPVYPETKGVSSKWIRRQITNLLIQHRGDIEEYLPENLIKKNNFFDIQTAIGEVHFPESLESAKRAKDRIAFDELLFLQLASTKRRREWIEKKKGNKFEIIKFQKKIDQLIESLPFTLTSSQLTAIQEILNDLSSTKPMNRLLQGDVGSGKTIVSAITMYATFLNGFQSVMMAPTEILANQHYATIYKLLSPLGVRIDLVTGNKRIRNQELGIKEENKKNHDSSFIIPNSKQEPDILIGTHAVLSKKIEFKKLGFIAIDEQQRFGVDQRGIIRSKGNNPHLLTMTATPIPRTVALTMYGDLDLSYLNEMPKGRRIIKTWLVPPEKRTSAYDWIRKQIKETDSQVFIICPFIEDSESMTTIKAAKSEYEKLKNKIFPDLSLGMLHGKLKSKEKDEVLSDFRKGTYDILVATPVVEVGIDIPNATIIMIEASERFGLAQLHQLRGRVGRNEKQSYCLLFTDKDGQQNSRRLKGMETLHSGAELAELDLKLRGPGNIYGTNQHGVPKLKAADFSDTDLLQKAKLIADKLYENLPKYPLLLEKVKSITLQKVSPD